MLPLRGFTQECEGRYQSVHGAGFTLAHLSPPESPSRDPYTCYTLRASPAVRSVCDPANMFFTSKFGYLFFLQPCTRNN
jgi:hypothetical protein